MSAPDTKRLRGKRSKRDPKSGKFLWILLKIIKPTSPKNLEKMKIIKPTSPNLADFDVKVHPPSVDGYFGCFFRMLQIEWFHHYFDAECIQNHFQNIVESCLAIKTLQYLYKPIIPPPFSLDLTPKSTNFLWNFRIFYFRADFRSKFGKSTSEKCKNMFFQTK